jgi:Fuc2NAc and GlcNAc transferase
MEITYFSYTDYMDNYFLFLVCLVAGGVGAWAVVRLGSRFSLLDISNHRSSHDGVVPKGGGIGLLAAFVFASLFLEEPLVFWLPVTVLALFSLLGDRIEISPKIRLPVQFIAAFSFLIPISDLWLLTPVSSFLFTVFFTVFIVATASMELQQSQE